MLNRIISSNKGYTLMETLVATGILLLVAYLSSDFIITTFRSTRFANEQDLAIQSARRGLEIMAREIRGANNSEQGAYPLNRIQDDDLIYFSDIDDDSQTEKVRYFLVDTDLKRVVTEPGPSDDYSGAGATTTISQYINNDVTDIFTYYDNDYAQTAVINDVRLIQVTLMVNVTPEIQPNDYIIVTDVHMRNLKDN